MIQHGKTEVSLAMRDRQVITNISRGRHTLFEYSFDINAATKAHIKSEYGNEVWKDVRDYAKAHPQIAPFINQDPEISISISTKTNKTRWLVGDGKAYIITELTASADSEYETKVIPSTTQNASYFALFGCGYECTTYIGSNQANHNGKYGNVFRECKNNVEMTIKLGSYGFILNGGEPRALTSSYNAQNGGRNMWIFHANIGNGAIWTGFMAYYKQTKGGSQYAHLIPYNNGTECGMLDLVTYTFHPNANTAGNFTIAITNKTTQ